MTLESIKCTDFRCLKSVELEFAPGNNLIYGANGSGKTSILEAVAFLGRGRSFRGASIKQIVRHGQEALVIFGRAHNGRREETLGVRNGPDGLEVHTNSEKRQSAAALAEALPLQVIDPDVHKLVAGGPEDRRRFVDWIVFHVEHDYLEYWRRYRRALKQRNAALRDGVSAAVLVGWDAEIAELGDHVDSGRKRALTLALPYLKETGLALLQSGIECDYHQGWASDQTLAEALRDSLERDRGTGTTHVGPHRADVRVKIDERAARKLVSRGQQKLLACGMILGATGVVQQHLQQPLLLLLDDPAAELDRDSVGRLMGVVEELNCQVVATTLERDQPLFRTLPRLFHVEHGVIKRVP